MCLHPQIPPVPRQAVSEADWVLGAGVLPHEKPPNQRVKITLIPAAGAASP